MWLWLIFLSLLIICGSITKLFHTWFVSLFKPNWLPPAVTQPEPPTVELFSDRSSCSPPAPPSGKCLHVGSGWAPAGRSWTPSSALRPCIVTEGTPGGNIRYIRFIHDTQKNVFLHIDLLNCTLSSGIRVDFFSICCWFCKQPELEIESELSL